MFKWLGKKLRLTKEGVAEELVARLFPDSSIRFVIEGVILKLYTADELRELATIALEHRRNPRMLETMRGTMVAFIGHLVTEVAARMELVDADAEFS